MIRAELLKLKRSLVWVVVPILPILAVVSGGVNYVMNREVLVGGWDSLVSQVTLFYGMIFYSVGVAMVASASWRPEHRSSTWSFALASGSSRLRLFLAKSLVMMLPVTAIQLCLIAFTQVFGTVVGMRGVLPTWFVYSMLLVVIVSVPLVLFQSLVSMLLKSFAAPIAICLFICVGSFGATAAGGLLATLAGRCVPQGMVTQAMLLGSSALTNAGALTPAAAAPFVAAAALVSVLLVLASAAVVRVRTVVAH